MFKYVGLVGFFAVVGVDGFIDEVGDNQRGEAAGHDHPEEVHVTDRFLDVTGNEARQHHAQRHKGGADGIVRRLELALAEVHHVQHVSRETEAVAKLLNAQGDSDNHDVSGLGNSQIDKRQARQRHARGHHPQRFFQTHTRRVDTTQDTS